MKLEAKKKPAPAIALPPPTEEPAAEVLDPTTDPDAVSAMTAAGTVDELPAGDVKFAPKLANPMSVLHLRCKDSTQIGPFGQSIDAGRSAAHHDVEMMLRPELFGVEVMVNLGGIRRRFIVPLSLVAHCEMENLGPATPARE